MRELHSARQNAQPQHQKDVANNRACNGGFNNAMEPLVQSQSSDNEFRGVSERRIEQPANAGTHLLCQVALSPYPGTIARQEVTKMATGGHG